MADDKINLKRKIIDQAVALTVTGLARGALPRAQADGREMFDVDDDGNVVPKDGAPATLDTFTQHLKKTAPFYFGESNGHDSRKAAKQPKTIKYGDSKALSDNLEAIASGDVVVEPKHG